MTIKVKVGDIFVGGDAPVSVQTMYDEPLSGLSPEFEDRMNTLKSMGCDVMRFSYPNISEHDCLCKAVSLCPMPSIADIHFDYRNALDALDCHVAGIRINPGNIGATWKTEEIIRKAKDSGVAIRIGLNGGSLKEGSLVEKALCYVELFEKLNFRNTVVSLKDSSPDLTYKANKEFAAKCDYPLHLGVTEAGGVVTSCVRSTLTLGQLLREGVGATIRYSITGSIEDEVIAGNELLKSLGLRKRGVRIISCPMCGRKSFNTQAFLKKVEGRLMALESDICIAIMGCQVNGPGEAKGADVAVSGIGKKVFLYKNGRIYCEIHEDDAEKALFDLVTEIENER